MRSIKICILALMMLLLGAAFAEDTPDIDFTQVYPKLILGEPYPEELTDVIGTPYLYGAGKYDLYVQNSEEEALRILLSYYAGAHRIVSISAYHITVPAAYEECGSYPVAGGTRLDQLAVMNGIEGLEIEERDGGGGRACFRLDDVSYEATYNDISGEKVITALKICDAPAALERMLGTTDSTLTLEDMNAAVIMETTLDELTEKHPDYHFEDHSDAGRPYVSLTYTLSDCTHFTYCFVERNGEYVLEIMYWVPENKAALAAEPKEYNVSRKTAADDFSFLKIGETTLHDVAKQYMDKYGMAASQRPDIVIANKDGEQVALWFGPRDTYDGNSTLYAIQRFSDNLWLHGTLMYLPDSVK